MLKKIFKVFVLVSLGCAFYLMTVVVVFQDISLEPILDKPYASLKEKHLKDPVYLISYADGDEIFFQNQNFLVHSAINKGIDHFVNYRRNLLDTDFLKEYAHILNEKFGAGLWLWKPWIILDTLKKAPRDAIIIYCDTGYCICGELDQVFESIKEFDVILGKGCAIDDTFGNMTKPLILEKNGIDITKAKEAPIIYAGFIVVKNTPIARAFIEKWFELCKNKDFLTGENYGDGRHIQDQSLLNITYHNNPENVKLLENDDVAKFLNWHHRKNDRKTISLTAYLRKYFTVFERKALNAPVLKDIRYYLRRQLRTLLEKRPQASSGL